MADNPRRRTRREQKPQPPAKPAKKPAVQKKPRARAAARAVKDPLIAATRAVSDAFEKAHLAPEAVGKIFKPGTRPVDAACRLLMDLLRRHCPDLLPREPLKPGEASTPIPVQPRETSRLISMAARQAVIESISDDIPGDPARLPASVLWQEGADALLVDLAGIDVRIADGLVTVVIPVRCDQLREGRDVVQIDFVVGTPDRPTGLLAATTEPRGPRDVVRRWGGALTALGWQAMLDAVGGLAAAAGRDTDGATLIPVALTATGNGLAVIPQARHQADRMRIGRVIAPPVRVGAFGQ
jgi:hypothetical protein